MSKTSQDISHASVYTVTCTIILRVGSFLAKGVAFVASMLTMACTVNAASWPEKPVRIIVPAGAGGGTDIQARLLTGYFHTATKQSFVIDNRPGGGTLIGTEMTVESPPNGYTALLTTTTIAISAAFLGKRMKFDVMKDLLPVSRISTTPLVLLIHPTIPAKSVKELISLAKQRPGILNIGVNLPGSTSHLCAEMLNQFAKIDSAIIPFKSGSYAMTSLVSGEIDVLFAAGSVAVVYVPTGKIRALAVTSAKQSTTFPDLPTLNTIYHGFESENWYAMFFPAGTPQDIVDKMNQLIVGTLKEENMRAFMKKNALDPVGSSPEELRKTLQLEIVRYREVIRKGHMKLP